MTSRLTAAFLLASVFAGVAIAADKMPVSIYFESLCSDSQNFIKGTFRKGYDTLKDNLDLIFVPYGHVKNGSCQHGPVECEGNRIIGCAIHKLNSTEKIVAFIECIMSLNSTNVTPPFPAEQCRNVSDSHYDDIITCSNATEGFNYFNEYGVQTNTTFGNASFNVPYVILNNSAPNDELSRNLTSDFFTGLCNNMKDRNLSACKSSASSLVASFFTALLALAVARL